MSNPKADDASFDLSKGYYCYTIRVDVKEHGKTGVLSSAETKIPNAY